MAGTREIRSKIRSVENTRKITKAMEMVAASKMRKAQDRMEAGRPYCNKVRQMAQHLMQANPEYEHPYMQQTDEVKSLGIVLVTTDRGLRSEERRVGKEWRQRRGPPHNRRRVSEE